MVFPFPCHNIGAAACVEDPFWSPRVFERTFGQSAIYRLSPVGRCGCRRARPLPLAKQSQALDGCASSDCQFGADRLRPRPRFLHPAQPSGREPTCYLPLPMQSSMKGRPGVEKAGFCLCKVIRELATSWASSGRVRMLGSRSFPELRSSGRSIRALAVVSMGQNVGHSLLFNLRADIVFLERGLVRCAPRIVDPTHEGILSYPSHRHDEMSRQSALDVIAFAKGIAGEPREIRNSFSFPLAGVACIALGQRISHADCSDEAGMALDLSSLYGNSAF